MSIEDVRCLCNDESIEMTSHVFLRCNQRKIKYSDIKYIIWNGDIIEEYENDYPYPSCLICGRTFNNRVLHVVVGIGDNKLWLITAYEPTLDKWREDMKTRRSE